MINTFCNKLLIGHAKSYAFQLTILVALILSYMPSYSQTLDGIAASVNGEAITNSALQTRVRFYRFQEGIDTSQISAEDLRGNALEEEIAIRLQVQEAQRIGIEISEGEVSLAIIDLSESNQMTKEEYVRTLAESGITEAQIRKRLHDQLVIRRLVDARIEPRVRVSDDQVKRYLDANKEQFEPVPHFNLNVVSVVIPSNASSERVQLMRENTNEIARVLRNGVPLEEIEEELSRYEEVDVGRLGWISADSLVPEVFEAVQGAESGSVVGPVSYLNNILVVIVNDFQMRPPIAVELAQLYRLRQIRLTVQENNDLEELVQKLEGIREQALAGSDFAELASTHSEDANSRQSGGDMGWLEAKRIPVELNSELESLNPGEITSVFEFGDSVHLFQLVDARLEDKDEAIGNIVRNRLRALKIDDEQRRMIRQLRQNAAINYNFNY